MDEFRPLCMCSMAREPERRVAESKIIVFHYLSLASSCFDSVLHKNAC